MRHNKLASKIILKEINIQKAHVKQLNDNNQMNFQKDIETLGLAANISNFFLAPYRNNTSGEISILH